MDQKLQVRQEKIFGTLMPVIQYQGKDYLVGLEVSHLLDRETFNLYRSMKMRRIELIRATPAQIENLVELGAAKPGTRSLTLTSYEESLVLISDIRGRQKTVFSAEEMNADSGSIDEDKAERKELKRKTRASKRRAKRVKYEYESVTEKQCELVQCVKETCLEQVDFLPAGSETSVELSGSLETIYPNINFNTSINNSVIIDQTLLCCEESSASSTESPSYDPVQYNSNEISQVEPYTIPITPDLEAWLEGAVLDNSIPDSTTFA